MQLERLYPEPARLSSDQAIGGLGLADRAPADRPYLVLNMVSTLDGKAAVDGRTRALSSEPDRAMFHHLRTQADAVMVGAGTARIERYGRIVRDPKLREKRRREGLEADPVACIVSGSLDLPADLPLFQDPDSRVLIVTASRDEIPNCAAQVGYLRMPEGDFELAPRLVRLRAEHGLRSILCEGGPTLNASLLVEGLVDELFLTLSPQLAGGTEAPTIVGGLPLATPAEVELVSMLRAGDELFLRLRLAPGAA